MLFETLQGFFILRILNPTRWLAISLFGLGLMHIVRVDERRVAGYIWPT